MDSPSSAAGMATTIKSNNDTGGIDPLLSNGPPKKKEQIQGIEMWMSILNSDGILHPNLF